MQRTATLNFTTRSYWLLTKPGIVLGNALTAFAGFALASGGNWAIGSFLKTMLGLSFIIASACVFNNYIDRAADAKMQRTKNRALAKRSISARSAILFALILLVLGTFTLTLFCNVLAMGLALLGFCIYVFFYSFCKYYSKHGTLIGSIAGAIPPLVGYCSASARMDRGAWIFFSILVFWQMPHFFSIALYRLEDYAAAAIPVLPLQRGISATKVQMALYVVAFMMACSALFLCGYKGHYYLISALLLGFCWLYLCLKGFKCKDEKVWARKMFFLSLAVIMALSLAIAF